MSVRTIASKGAALALATLLLASAAPAAGQTPAGGSLYERLGRYDAIAAVVDNTWDGRYALPFCATLRAEGDVRYCLMLSVRYLGETFETSKEELRVECASRLVRPEACLEAVEP